MSAYNYILLPLCQFVNIFYLVFFNFVYFPSIMAIIRYNIFRGGDTLTLGENIKKYRKEKNMTQAQLARKIDSTDSAITRYETNTREPSIDILNKIAAALGVTIGKLLEEGTYNLTETDKVDLSFLYDEDLVLLVDLFKRCNYVIREIDNKVFIEKNDKIIATTTTDDFIDMGKKILDHVKEFTDFELNKLIDIYRFLG